MAASTGTHNTWVGRWAGGRIQEGRRGRTFWIERSVEGKRHAVRLKGVASEKEAVRELERWEADPNGYEPPSVRLEIAAAEAREREAAKKSGVVLTGDLIDEFVKAASDGYGTRQPVSTHHAFVLHSFLSDWATSPVLHGRDLRDVTLAVLREQLETGRRDDPKRTPWGSHKHRIVALRSLTAWLRWKGALKRTDDPTLDLTVPQARRPTPKERSEKVYTVAQIEQTYRYIPNSSVRSVFYLRVHAGLHVSEIKRIAAKDCEIRKLKGQGEIACTVDVKHKGGQVHRQSLDKSCLAHIERLQALATFPTEKTFERNRTKACTGANEKRPKGSPAIPEIMIGNLRATRTTLAETLGAVVYPKDAKRGVPLEIIARTHGHAPETAAKFYSGTNIPPMVVIPVNLSHPGD